ncbi:MAG TPA: TIGR03943 family protein [Propionibacteriaceae bacterium]|nr:TIGR03943 family protein [Propionibacteriaceae bacterium]
MGVIATIWLAATGRLTLYVHPRYTLLTVMMAVLTLLLLVLAAAVGVSSDADEDSDHDHVTRVSAFGRLLIWSKAAVLICAALALLVIPPATLSSSARQNRELVTSGQALDSTKVAALVGADPATFSVKDWAALLSQGGPEAVLGKQVNLSGYVLDRGKEDVFFIARLVVSCCAVDAQPIGVPVYRPGWRAEVEPGAWITIEGAFVNNPSRDSQESVAIGVGSLAHIDEPDQPYVF